MKYQIMIYWPNRKLQDSPKLFCSKKSAEKDFLHRTNKLYSIKQYNVWLELNYIDHRYFIDEVQD